MDSESLDRCIQTALSALYPPFQATSPTVLCQVLSVVESCYRGDGLRYLIHFLLPAKQLLVNLQQDACTQYCGLLFRHEGWPLCVHDKVAVQLCPLDQHLLRPGDFYLLVSPPPAAAPRHPRARGASSRSPIASSPRLLLCSLSVGGRHVEQQEVSEIALRSLFSMAWLDSVNREREQRGAPRLERCVLSAHGDVFRVPWEDLVYPQFINRPRNSLKEDKESSVKDGDMLINTSHNACNNSVISRQDVKLLPSSTKGDQSPASSEDEESEGEYVELAEIPLPRFSPQKGSLTQSISLQHRARASTHTPVHTHTTTHTPQNAYSSAHTHINAATHPPTTTNTHTAGTTQSSRPFGAVSSHSDFCSRLIEANLNQDSYAPAICPPTSSSSSSCFVPPEDMGTSGCQVDQRTSQEQIEGTDSGRSLKLNTDPANNTEQREEEVEEGKEEVKTKEREKEETEVMERQKDKYEMVVLVDEGEEEEEQLEGTECRREDLLCTHTEEEEDKSEEDIDLDEEEEELEEYEAEVEVEEEIQFIIVQQSQERRHEKQVVKEDERQEGVEEEERRGEQEHMDEKVDSSTNTHSEEGYSESNTLQTHTEDSYSENTLQMHTEDSYCENALQTQTEDSYCENTLQTQAEDSYSENTLQTHTDDSNSENTLQTHTDDSNSENTLQTHTDDSNSENTLQTQTDDSYRENMLQTHSEDSYSENTLQTHSEDSYSENTLQTHSEDSYSENTLQTHSEDSYSENTLQTHTDDSYCENTLQTHTEDSYCENTLQTHTEDSYSENTLQTHTDDTCCEKTLQTHSEDSYSENSLQTNSENSHCENTLPTHIVDSYCENTLQTNSEDSYCENTLQTQTEDSYSENTLQTHTDDTCCEKTLQTQTEDSYSEKTLQTHTEDSYCEYTVQTNSEDSYSEKTLQTHSEDSYCENTVQTNSEDSYCENTLQTQTEDSYSEKTLQTHSKDSYSENTLQTHTDDTCCEKTLQTQIEDSYSEKTLQTHSEDSYCENTVQTNSEDSHSENTVQTNTEDSYSEDTLQTHTDDTYCEITVQTNTEDSYCENKIRQADDSYCENTVQTNIEDSYCENPLQTNSENSYCENTLQTQTEDSYSENTLQTNTEDSYCENTIQRQADDSYCENTLQTNMEDSYCENTSQTNTEDSNCESTPVMVPESLRNETESPVDGQEKQVEKKTKEEGEKKKEEEEEEHSCEEVGGGRTEDLHTEGQSHPNTSTGPIAKEPEPPAAQLDWPAARTLPRLTQSSQSHQSSFYRVLLSSGALCLPGSRDRSGRALLTVSTANTVWSNPDCDSAELLRLLLYYTSTLRKELRASGLTVLVDARRAAPLPALFAAFRSLQDNIPGSIHTVFLLVNKDSPVHVDKPATPQVEVLSSLKSVYKQVEPQQLPAEFGGSLSFSQRSWLCFRSRVEQLSGQCENVIKLLQKTINILQTTPLPAAAQDAELLLSRHKAVMHSILVDSRLVQLQQEGGASLARLRGVVGTEDQRAVVETVSALYDDVDELLHRLVTLSNARTQELNFIVDFSGLEKGFTEVRSWLQDVGEVRLKSLDEPEDSLELLSKKQQDFKEFHATAYERCRQGEALLRSLEHWGDITSADLHVYEVKVHSFWAQLQDFSQRVKTSGQNIERAVGLYRFLDQAYGWSLAGMRHLAAVSMEECTLPDKCQAVIGCLEDYHRQHPPIPDARFQEMKAVAGELRGERGLRQWSFAWSKCQETKKMFDRKLEAALRTRDSAHRQRSDSTCSRSSISSRKTLSGLWGFNDTSSLSSSCPPEEDANTSSPPRHSSFSLLPITSTPAPASSHHTPQHTPLLQRLFRSTSSDESPDRVDICSSSPSLPRLGSSACSSSSSSSSFSSSRRQQLRKTQSFDCPSTPEASRYGPCPRALSEPVRRGNTGVFIRGLEVSSTEAADHTLCPRTGAHGWAGQSLRSPGTPGTPRTASSPATDSRPRGSKLRHIVEEMVTTEREYVRSLRYIIHHYFPEMDRADLPQDLRGKRSVVFGNLEKLLDFHSQFFLRELEACWKHPLRVPHCFLRHQEQFSLYALYSKNKPKSDALLANHGNSFFRKKQVELGDKMDLSSYLLKPVQRMSKYALLLTDLMKEVGVAQEAELVALQAATDMVKFQLRHGNDLLAMDAIRDCDVNLKEQGQLIRQDEFTVWTGRRKCQRHIFLFEELVLFSKPKKMEGGLDVFIYKHSFKTADVGLTESAGDDGLRFEIWFRRRTAKNQTFILQAASSEVKHAWTTGIARILWTQATRNKEMRLKEMVSMGVGNKPFLDIQPSDAAISDRAVHYIMKSRGARTRASIAVSVFDHSNPFKRGSMTSEPSSSSSSGPSSSGLLGPLNLHMYSQTLSSSPAAESSFITSCIEEDEQEHETSSQPSMTTESSGSSSRCLSGSTGSDSGCVSSNLQEALGDEPSRPPHLPPQLPPHLPPSSSNKQHLSSQYISPKAAPVISPATIV